MKKNLILLILLTTVLSAWAAGAKETPQRVFFDVVETIQKNDKEKLNFFIWIRLLIGRSTSIFCASNRPATQ